MMNKYVNEAESFLLNFVLNNFIWDLNFTSLLFSVIDSLSKEGEVVWGFSILKILFSNLN